MSKNSNLPEIRRAPRNMKWPGDRHVAVVFNVAYEVWSGGVASDIVPMGNPLAGGIFDANADSYGRYDANAGIQRLVRILKEAGVSARHVFPRQNLSAQYCGCVASVLAPSGDARISASPETNPRDIEYEPQSAVIGEHLMASQES